MIVRWDPLNEMNSSLQREINRLFTDTRTREGGAETGHMNAKTWAPPVDITEDEKEFNIKVEIPGVKQEDIDVHLGENQLSIKGEKKFLTGEENYLRQEIGYGSFFRAFNITCPVQEDNIRANYENGILKISLPKEEKTKPKKIKIM